MSYLIREMCEEERPRERLKKYGVESLSNEELLSIILKTGTKKYNVKTLASYVLSSVKNIHDLRNLTINS